MTTIPPVPVGPSSKVGFALTLLLLLSTIWLAFESKDEEAMKTGIAGLVVWLSTHGGRVAQAVVATKAGVVDDETAELELAEEQTILDPPPEAPLDALPPDQGEAV